MRFRKARNKKLQVSTPKFISYMVHLNNHTTYLQFDIRLGFYLVDQSTWWTDRYHLYRQTQGTKSQLLQQWRCAGNQSQKPILGQQDRPTKRRFVPIAENAGGNSFDVTNWLVRKLRVKKSSFRKPGWRNDTSTHLLWWRRKALKGRKWRTSSSS